MLYIVVYTCPETENTFSAHDTTLESALIKLVRAANLNNEADFYMDYLEVYRGEPVNIIREIKFIESN